MDQADMDPAQHRANHGGVWDEHVWYDTRMMHTVSDPSNAPEHTCGAHQTGGTDDVCDGKMTSLVSKTTFLINKMNEIQKASGQVEKAPSQADKICQTDKTTNKNNDVEHEHEHEHNHDHDHCHHHTHGDVCDLANLSMSNFADHFNRFAQSMKINTSVVHPADGAAINKAYNLLYNELRTMSFCPDRHAVHGTNCEYCAPRLVYDSPPAPGNPLDQHSKDHPVYYAQDHRPTLDVDKVLTHHCGIHDCDRCLVTYLGCRSRGEAAAIALSGPVLKHLSAFYALLTPTEEPSWPNLEEVCGICAHALSLLLKHEIRVMLPSSLPEIESHFGLTLRAKGLSNTAVIATIVADIRRRAELVACLVLSLYGELIKACRMTPEEYDAQYAGFARELENQNNPWGSNLFLVEGTPGAYFRLPFLGPLPNACRCSDGSCTTGEHDVEAYHRVLSLVRWTLEKITADPAVYYHRKTGLGRALRHEYECKYLLTSVKNILAEQTEDWNRPARAKLLEDIRGKHLCGTVCHMFAHLQECSRLDNLFDTSPLSGAGVLIPALLVNSPSSKVENPFPKDGDAQQKEAWVKDLEDRIWRMLSVGLVAPTEYPDLIPEVRWFARYRTIIDHGYVAVPTAQDILDDKKAGRGVTSAEKRAIEENSKKVQVAVEKMQAPKARLDVESSAEGKEAFFAWVNGHGASVWDVYRLAGAEECDRNFLMALTSQFLCYTWMAARSERALQRGPEPTADEIDFWCKNLTMVTGNRAEFGFYFRDKISQDCLNQLLQAVIRSCHPGESWLRSCGVPPPAIRALKHENAPSV